MMSKRKDELMCNSFSKTGKQIHRMQHPNEQPPKYVDPYQPRKSYSRQTPQHTRPPFDSLGRQSITPFLLYYSKQSGKKHCYSKNYSRLDSEIPKWSFPKHPFQRMIQYTRAKRNLKKFQKKSINVSDTNVYLNSKIPMNYQSPIGNTQHDLHHLDFDNMESHDRKYRSFYKQPIKKLDQTQISQRCKNITTRTSKIFKIAKQKQKKETSSHSFESYIPRKFLEIPIVNLYYQQEKAPFFDILAVDYSKVKKDWVGKVDLKFKNFRQKIRVKQDRQDPLWSMSNQYDPKMNSVDTKVFCPKMNKTINRMDNVVPNPYPIRASLQIVPRDNLKQQRKAFSLIMNQKNNKY